MPRVSVIMPTYNRAEKLPRSIESVLNQTLEEFELLVVDDGSSDETEAVVTAYDDPRVKYVAHETNHGASAARNTGIDHADGEYIALLDSDDEFEPEKLEKQVDLLESRSDDWVAAYCGVDIVFEDGEQPNRLKQWLVELVARGREMGGAEGGEELIGEVLTDRLHTSAGSTLLVERSVAEAIDGFDESFDRFQDPEFLIRVLKQGKLGYVDDELVKRYASDSPSADALAAADEHYLEAFADTVERLEAQGYDIIGAHHYLIAKQYLMEGDFRNGMRYLLSARRPAFHQWPGLFRSIARGVRQRSV